MIEVTHYIITFSSKQGSIIKGFQSRVFVTDEIDLLIYRYEIAQFFKVSVGSVALVTRVNFVRLWWGDLTIKCKYMKFKRTQLQL